MDMCTLKTQSDRTMRVGWPIDGRCGVLTQSCRARKERDVQTSCDTKHKGAQRPKVGEHKAGGDGARSVGLLTSTMM